MNLETLTGRPYWGVPGVEQLPRVTRAWAKPSPYTFQLWPLQSLFRQYLTADIVSVDPFAGNARVATFTNDLDPTTAADSHLDALDFCQHLTGPFDAVLFDPPYSPRQMAECYHRMGMTGPTRNSVYSRVKTILAPLVTVGGLAICCGWNTSGFGRRRGFELIELVIVVHGSAHNDTLVTVERKREQEQLALI